MGEMRAGEDEEGESEVEVEGASSPEIRGLDA